MRHQKHIDIFKIEKILGKYCWISINLKVKKWESEFFTVIKNIKKKKNTKTPPLETNQ